MNTKEFFELKKNQQLKILLEHNDLTTDVVSTTACRMSVIQDLEKQCKSNGVESLLKEVIAIENIEKTCLIDKFLKDIDLLKSGEVVQRSVLDIRFKITCIRGIILELQSMNKE